MLPNQTSRGFNLSLIVLLTLNILPHIEDHSVVICSVTVLCLVWRGLYEFQRLRLPKLTLKFLFVILSFILVHKVYGQISGVEAATGLLIAGISLKLVDSSSYHDSMVILFLNFLLLMSRFLVSQTLPMTLLGVITIILVTALLIQLHKGNHFKMNTYSLLRTGSRLFLQATPLLVLLFFIFPRYSVGFFRLNNEVKSKSGFSGKVEPGSISKLLVSDQTAFRVEVSGGSLLPNRRYWRGATLEKSHGMSWETLTPANNYVKRVVLGQEQNHLLETIKQKVVLEPHYGNWLFALDKPVSVEFRDRVKNSQISRSEDLDYRIKTNNGQKISYEALSSDDLKLALGDPMENLEIPQDNDLRLQNLISSVVNNYKTEEDIVDAYLKFFKKNLNYTLTPKPMKSLNVSEFLFETQQGFCEHMSASFAYLLRASQIPARVVVGFQGGVENEFGGHYTVKERDAHAWVEMWSARQASWIRVDPTQYVAPLRIDLGAEVYHSLSQDELQAGLTQEEYLLKYKSSWYYRYIVQSELALDLVSLRWSQFLLDFDREGQKDFFRKLGLQNLKTKYLAYSSFGILIFFILFLNYRKLKIKKPIREEIKSYQRLVQFFQARGLKKEAFQGPLSYLNLAKEKWPSASGMIDEFSKVYQTRVYGPPVDNEEASLRLRNLQNDIYKEVG